MNVTCGLIKIERNYNNIFRLTMSVTVGECAGGKMRYKDLKVRGTYQVCTCTQPSWGMAEAK